MQKTHTCSISRGAIRTKSSKLSEGDSRIEQSLIAREQGKTGDRARVQILLLTIHIRGESLLSYREASREARGSCPFLLDFHVYRHHRPPCGHQCAVDFLNRNR